MNEDCKKKCQIFTPLENVNELLDWVGYEKDLYGKKILEPTFGKGNILIKIVERYILNCLSLNFTVKKIKHGLENDVYGIEYDKKYFNMCLKSLNELAGKYKITNVKWNLFCGDSLKFDYDVKFDFVVGNPPYISYRLLDLETRQFVRNKFSVCSKGKFDYCYAFIESSINNLAKNGQLAFLLPGSIFKNVFSQNLRNFIIDDLVEIHDYGSRKLFNEEADGTKRNILTSSSVIIIKKESKNKSIRYFNEEDNSFFDISKSLLAKKWIFVQENFNKKGKYRFGDYFKVANSIATLYNKAFLVDMNDELYYNKAEKLILKTAVSPKSIEYGNKQKIIFPYLYEKGKLKRIVKEDFEKNFPSCSQHLNQYDNNLKLRKSDVNTEWFEYGRSQALQDMNQPKLLTSIVVTGKMKVYELSKNVIPYSGIYIIPKSALPLIEAKKILESLDFYEYIRGVGINASGDSFRITSKDISNYYFD